MRGVSLAGRCCLCLTALLGPLGLAGLAAPAAAQGGPLPLTGELQVNQFTTNNQDAPAVGMRDDGQHVVVWRSDGQDGAGSTVVFRKFPGDGSQPFNEGVLNQVTAGDQSSVEIGMNANGDWLAVWQIVQLGQGIRGRASSNNGSSLGAEFQVSVEANGPQQPAASRADDDSSVATWQTQASFRRFDSATAPLSGDVDPAPDFPFPFDLRVASAPSGAFVIVFADDDADELGVFAQRFDAAGSPVGDAIPLAESTDDDQQDVDVGMAADGSFVVAWIDDADGFRARCFTAGGEARGGEVGVDPSLGNGLRLAVAPGGAFAITYTTTEVRLREFDRTCHPVGEVFTVNTTTSGNQSASAVAAGADRFVVAWQSQNLDGNAFGVARRLYRFRSIFADDFESNDLVSWSATAP